MNKRKVLNILLSCIIVISFLCIQPLSTQAQEATSTSQAAIYNFSCSAFPKLNEQQQDTLNKIVSISKFYTLRNNHLRIRISNKELADTYNFTSKQIIFFITIFLM